MSILLGLPILLIIVICVVVFLIHFIPTFVAANRKARNFLWIFLINLFFGWTLLGWCIALVWAIQDTPKYMVTYAPPPRRY